MTVKRNLRQTARRSIVTISINDCRSLLAQQRPQALRAKLFVSDGEALGVSRGRQLAPGPYQLAKRLVEAGRADPGRTAIL